MAKEKRSAADLDAELAALEAELAALEGKKPKKAKAEPAKAAKPEPATPEPAAEPAKPEAEKKKGRFSLPLPSKKGKKEEAKDAPPAPATAPVAAPDVSPAERAPPAPPPRTTAEDIDATLWRQDGDAWVRTVPGTPVASVRRVLDENGNVVREEPVTENEVEATSAVKAERGLGRLLRRK